MGILEGPGGWVIRVAVVGGLQIFGGSLDQREDFKEPVFIVSARKFRLGKDVKYIDSTTPTDVRWVISLEIPLGRYSQGTGSSTMPLATRSRSKRS